jgi:hypothetical protein
MKIFAFNKKSELQDDQLYKCKISTIDVFYNYKLQVHKMFMKYSFSSFFIRYKQKSTAVTSFMHQNFKV